MQKIELITQDAVKLSALYWPGSTERAVILLHMMPATKESWIPLADKIALLGITVLAPDFRGHGKSEGGNYQDFTDQQHQQYYADLQTAVAYLQNQNLRIEISMAGASIGANETIKYMANHPEIKRGVAISAGTDYYGVRAIDDIQNLSSDQHLLLVAAEDDVRKNGLKATDMQKELAAVSSAQTQTLVYETGGHGTDIWQQHPELIDEIIQHLNLEQH